MAAIKTYHCPCTTLLIATTFDLSTLPRRASPSADQAIILPISNGTAISTLENLTEDDPIIVRREDGFEKRIMNRCKRCKTIIGYELGNKVSNVQAMYILPGWLQTTEAMAAGRKVDGKEAALGQGESKAVMS